MDIRVHHRKPKLYLPYFQIQRALEIKNLSNRLLSQCYIPELMTSGQLFPQVKFLCEQTRRIYFLLLNNEQH